MIPQLLYSLDEDDSVAHTNLNSPRSKPTSMAPSPTSQQNFNQHQLNNEPDNGIRVTFSQSNSTGNHTINFSNSQKNSIEIQDGQDADAEQPLLTKQSSLSKSS